MQDQNEIDIIDAFGNGEKENDAEKERRPSGGINKLLFMQCIICAAALICLAVMKYTDTESFEAAVSWYEQEIAREVQLPWISGTETSSQTSQPAESGAWLVI